MTSPKGVTYSFIFQSIGDQNSGAITPAIADDGNAVISRIGVGLAALYSIAFLTC